MALCGLRAYGATFFVFSDYMRPPIRLAALMGLPVLYIFTHDSIGVGEDGPTHQPIEHLAALRAIPGLVVLRPGDANEVAEAYKAVMQLRDRPAGAGADAGRTSPRWTARSMPRPPARNRAATCWPTPPAAARRSSSSAPAANCRCAWPPTNSLRPKGSRPAWSACRVGNCSTRSRAEYRRAVLPPEVTARVAVELGIEQGWCKYLGHRGRFLGMSGFGASGPGRRADEAFRLHGPARGRGGERSLEGLTRKARSEFHREQRP